MTQPGSRADGVRTGLGPARTGLVVAAVLVLFLLDFFLLRGEAVAHDRVSLRRDEPARIELSRVGESHTFELTTRTRRGGKTRGRAVAWRVEGPTGAIVAEGSEVVAHERRLFDVTPHEAGPYLLYVEENGLLAGGGSGRARVSVRVGDRRILARIFSLF